jgi:hypothetical protein
MADAGVVYGLVPVLDALLGEDRNNPPEALVPALEKDAWYRWLTWLAVPAGWLTVAAVAWVAVRGDLSLFGWLGLAVSAGWTSGAGINAAHELGHKKVCSSAGWRASRWRRRATGISWSSTSAATIATWPPPRIPPPRASARAITAS